MAEEKAVKNISVASPGFGLIDFAMLPSGATQEVVPLLAEDGGASRGVLYTRGRKSGGVLHAPTR
jgi:hypothetical protein